MHRWTTGLQRPALRQKARATAARLIEASLRDQLSALTRFAVTVDGGTPSLFGDGLDRRLTVPWAWNPIEYSTPA